MKVVSPKQMAELESSAYQQGYSEEDFMENAGRGLASVADQIAQSEDYAKNVVLLCGKGNNAGDAYVAGRELLKKGYRVAACQKASVETCSRLCQQQQALFAQAGGNIQTSIPFPQDGFLIDGIFGTGFRGHVEEPYASLIKEANASNLPILAVDIPSGLTSEVEIWNDPSIIHARHTIFLGLPKTVFFLGEAWNYVGNLHGVDFGLPQAIIDQYPAEMYMLTATDIKPLLPPIKRTRHKYERGYVIALAGSPSMPGAALLSCTAALRGGAGIVRLLYPEGMECVLSGSPYELIKQSYRPGNPSDLDEILDLMNHGSAVLIGPGLGRSQETQQLLRSLLPRIQKPSVIDADALALLALEDIPLPPDPILTPHKGELERLLRITPHQKITLDFLRFCHTYASEKQLTLLLKGGPTFIFHSDSPIYVNPTGNPGMATAGSGDVLTGLLAAFLAQGLPPLEAAKAGVFLHGLAGDDAMNTLTPNCMIAGDILTHFPETMRSLHKMR